VSGKKGFRNNYFDEMRSLTEKGNADRLGLLGYDVPQSEFKKPYQSPNYQGMEHYKKPENETKPPDDPPKDDPPDTPDDPPNTGCGNAAGVTRFCREGDVVMIRLPWVSASDPIVGVRVIIGQMDINSGLTGGMAAIVGGQFISYKPGNAGQAVLVATTKSGKTCTAQVAAKTETECQPPIYYMQPCCEGLAITYTTLQMQLGEDQELGVSGQGNSVCHYKWEIMSGGGTLSEETWERSGNDTTIYSAPSSNSDCSSNPTIALRYRWNESEEWTTCDTIKLAVNGNPTGGAGRYWLETYCNYLGGPYWEYGGEAREIYCDGSISDEWWAYHGGGAYPCPGTYYEDDRPVIIVNGCCPYQFM